MQALAACLGRGERGNGPVDDGESDSSVLRNLCIRALMRPL